MNEQTVYNGSAQCYDCDTTVDPIRAMFSQPVPRCESCQRTADDKHVRGMMTP